MIFVATDADRFEENEAYVVNFSDGQGERGNFLMPQRSTSSNPRDADLGLDGVYLQTNRYADYGTVDKIELIHPIIKIELADDTAKQFGIASALRIDINHSVDWGALEKFLRLIVGDSHLFVFRP